MDGVLADYVPTLLRTTRRDHPHHVDPRLPALAPIELHPVFHGCYDWHSAVHSHWSMTRLLRLGVRSDELRGRLEESFLPGPLSREAATVGDAPGFEEPYGLGWLLMLDAELRLAAASSWRAALTPLVALARGRLLAWMATALDESGLHHQTAFSLGLILRWADVTGDAEVGARAREAARGHWAAATGRSLLAETGPTDFLSPGLMAAVVMDWCIDGFPEWLSEFLPGLPRELDSVDVAVNTDPADGHGTHLDGLNLNRAWAARRLAGALPAGDRRRPHLEAFAARHAAAGLAASRTEHFSGSHWLPTFAILLLTDAPSASE